MVSRTEWVRESLMPAVVAHNWPGSALSKLDVGDRKGGNPSDGGFASNTYRVTLSILHEDGTESLHHVIAKVIPEMAELRAMHGSEKQFQNESNFYTKIVSAYQGLSEKSKYCDKLFPKCYLTVIESSELAAIVLEDLKHDEFTLAKQPATSLNESHAKLTLERLANFHALGYTLKHHKLDLYKELVSNIQESWYTANKKGDRDQLLKPTVERGLKSLRSEPEHAEFVSIFDRIVGNSPFDYEAFLATPRSPATDVLCHGDFLRNNVLFKYDANDEVCDLRMIDFATIRDASPALDICFFLYMSVSEEILSSEGVTNLLSHYHSALVSALKYLGGPSDPWKGDVSNLEREFGRHVLHAYFVCSFFLGIMSESSDFQIEEMFKMTPEEQMRMNLSSGGDVITRRLTNMLLQFEKKQFHFLWESAPKK